MTEEEALARLTRTNPDAPHSALIWVEAEVHELTKYGEMSGNRAHSVSRFPIQITAPNRDACIKRLNEALAQFKEVQK